MAKKGFADLITKLKPVGTYSKLVTEMLGTAGFRDEALPATDSGTIEGALPKSLPASTKTPDNEPGWFENEEALIYPQNLFQPGAQAYIYFVMRDSNIQSTAVKKRIGMYMPPGIRVNYGSTWEEINMSVSQSLDTIKTAANVFGSDSQAQDTAVSTLERMGLGAVANVAGAAVGDDTMGQQLEVATRKTVNPHQALLFKGVSFREFEFTFEMLARSVEESESIRQIIKVFKWGMHPGNEGGRYWTYPNTFDIYLLTPSHKYMFNISQCVLTKMDVDYGGSGAASFFKYTGAPVDIRMTLSFKELAVLTKDLIEQDY